MTTRSPAPLARLPPLAIAGAVLAGVAFLAVPEAVLPALYDRLVEVYIVAWLVTPVAIALDADAVARRTGWRPRTRYWVGSALLPLAGVGVGALYLLRRWVAEREPWTQWHRVTAGAWLAAIAGLLLGGTEETTTAEALAANAGLTLWLVATVVLPGAVIFDVRVLARRYGWDGDAAAWGLLGGVPFLNLLGGLVYLMKRNQVARERDPLPPEERSDTAGEADAAANGTEQAGGTEGGTGGTDEDGGESREVAAERPVDVDSDWWYWHAATVVLVPVGLVGLFGALVGVGDILTAFGALVVGAIAAQISIVAYYFDARAIDDADVDVGWSPEPAIYMVVSLLVTPLLTAPYYLYKRHKHLGRP